VVTFWRHDVTWKSGCFSAFERGDFLKNSGILQPVGRVLFVRLIGWWDRFEEFRQGREVTILIKPDEVNILCDVTDFLIDKA